MLIYRIYLGFLFTTLAIYFLAYYVAQRLLPFIIYEDGLVENLAVLFYTAAFVYSLVLLLRHHTVGQRKLICLIGVLGLGGALEELSYGERLFQLQMPRINGVKIDALYDGLALIVRRLSEALLKRSEITASLGIATLTAGMICAWKYRTALIKGWKHIWDQTPLRLLITGIVAALLAQVCDIAAKYPSILLVAEEVLEMNPALAVFLATIAIHYSENKRLTSDVCAGKTYP